ncbi:MAG: sigma-54 dependent transcriptional regulator [Planctomycetota bacterium]
MVIVTKSDAIRELLRMARRVARSSAPVLLVGESGTGKELFAQLIHDASTRSDQRLVRVNCAALSSNLVESELFGHEKGSFTDAVAQRVGRFEHARNGTLFLDEISEVPIATQAKLLRVLESNEFERVGSSTPVKHDVRIVAASNRDLEAEVQERRFRADLYHRLNVICLPIPPLRDRREDIEPLASHFLQAFKPESPRSIDGFTVAAMRVLSEYDWPGNVRELRNVVLRACLLCDSREIDILDLRLPTRVDGCAEVVPASWLETPLDETERKIILAALAREKSQQAVANKLGISPRTLTNKLRRYRSAA